METLGGEDGFKFKPMEHKWDAVRPTYKLVI
jgi:hypothetical protein